MTRYAWTVPPIWVLAIVAAVIVGVAAGPAFLTWSAVAMGALVIIASAWQLSLQQKEGFVLRLAASLAGSALILAIGGAILAGIYPESVASVLSPV